MPPSAFRHLLPVWPLALLASCTSTTLEPPLSVEWTAVSVGAAHVCGLGMEGAVYCWGSNRHAQLGSGTGTVTTVAVRPVSGSTRYSLVVSGSEHACAIATDAGAYCWGADDDGQLGIGRDQDDACTIETFNPFPCKATPAPVAGASRFVQLVAGQFHTCGLTAAGAAYCWGMNAWGQLGATSAETCGSSRFPCSGTPVEVGGGLVFTSIAAGGLHTCGVTDAGAAYCWGSNQYGELGGAAADTCGSTGLPCAIQPVQVSGTQAWVSLIAGYGHTCGLAADGQTYCWGWSDAGQLGTEAAPDACASGPCVPQPAPVSGGALLSAMAAGAQHTCGITSAGGGYCWGFGGDGELGNGNIVSHGTPVGISGGLVFSQISAGLVNTCAVSADRKAYCWGDNGSGQLGRSDFSMQSLPVEVTGR